MNSPPYTTSTKVANAARNIEVASGRAATMSEAQAEQFIDEAETIIDSKLSALYYTPLNQITRNSTTAYPDPISFIATRIAAALMVRAVYSRVEPNISENAEAHLKDAMTELDEISNGTVMGSRLLEGQRLKSRNKFLNPYAAPLEPPKGKI